MALAKARAVATVATVPAQAAVVPPLLAVVVVSEMVVAVVVVVVAVVLGGAAVAHGKSGRTVHSPTSFAEVQVPCMQPDRAQSGPHLPLGNIRIHGGHWHKPSPSGRASEPSPTSTVLLVPLVPLVASR
jgi:hypothetical protein